MSEQPPPVDVVLMAERAAVATHWVPAEQVRVRREVITEEMTVTVSVRREVLRIERRPLTGADGADGAVSHPPATANAATGPDVLEVLLSAERPVVSLEVVPYELVRLGVRSVATTTPVSVDLRHEVADVDQVTTRPR